MILIIMEMGWMIGVVIINVIEINIVVIKGYILNMFILVSMKINLLLLI